MAVYTPVSFDEASALFERLGLGRLESLDGVAAGIENTNYFADAIAPDGTPRACVLTVFERLSVDELPYFLNLMRHLSERGLPVPGPKADRDGQILHEVCGKPAAVVDRLRGQHHDNPDVAQCATVGATLARMHAAVADFPLRQRNLRDLAWIAETVPVVLPFLDDDQRTLAEGEVAYAQQVAASAAYASLPRGAVHADLFRDNVVFDDGPDGARLSGIFDFYFAGDDTFLYDLGVVLNDWCIDTDSGRLAEDRAAALVAAYDGVRSLSGAEHRLLPALMRAAALRFWVSRLGDLHLPRAAALLKAHDPGHFERVLRERVAAPWHAGG
jgi:homoserine kinase type II